MLKFRTLRILAVLVFSVCFSSSLFAQVTLDWAAKRLVSYPHSISQSTTTSIVVTNINDLLYSYKINVIAVPRAVDDAKNLLSPTPIVANAGEVIVSDCRNAEKSLTENMHGLDDALVRIFDPLGKEKLDDKGKPKSLALEVTTGDFNKSARELGKTINSTTAAGSIWDVQKKCTNEELKAAGTLLKDAQSVIDQFERYRAKVDGPHDATKVVTLEPDNDYMVLVEEFINTTKTNELSQTFSPESHVLTLSLGVLITPIAQRTFTTVKDPTDTTKNLLNVNGGGLTPLGVALLNYRIPKWTKGAAGISLSSGLVVRFGQNQSQVSTLGWFGGPSLHFYDRLFLTAGVHVGEFADFPPGLYPNTQVPANYGDINPTKRWTTRFAFAVTYKTAGFGSAPAKPMSPMSPSK